MIPTDWGLAGLIRAAFTRFAGEPLLVSADRVTTYADARPALDTDARLLREVRDVGCAAVLLPNSADYPLALLAIGAAGWCRTALNVVDPIDSHLHKIGATKADVLVTTAELLAAVGGPDALARTTGIARVLLVEVGSHDAATMLDIAAPTVPDAAWERDIASVYQLGFTGGTTGHPKGVALTHSNIRALTSLMWTELKQPGPGDVFHAVTPYSHASGAFVLPFALRGAAFSGAPTADVGALAEALDRGHLRDVRVTTFVVPTLLQRLADLLESSPGSWGRAPDTWFDTLVYGAAPTPPALARRAGALFGGSMVQLYAQAEAPMVVTTLPREEHHRHGTRAGSCVGYPAPLVQMWIRRGDGSEADVGEVGEICARGDHVMHGYWRNEEETRGKQDGRSIRTNDLGYLDEDGLLWVVGRNRDLVISGGFNVYPAQVEAVVTAVAGVAGAAVVGLPDEQWGESVVAGVVLHEGADETTVLDELERCARTRLAAFERPKSWVVLDAIPTTSLGKPDRDGVRSVLLGHRDRSRSVH